HIQLGYRPKLDRVPVMRKLLYVTNGNFNFFSNLNQVGKNVFAGGAGAPGVGRATLLRATAQEQAGQADASSGRSAVSTSTTGGTSEEGEQGRHELIQQKREQRHQSKKSSPGGTTTPSANIGGKLRKFRSKQEQKKERD
ncbi:unnamed protein product, partial [Amoebophrya sp. A120]